MADQVIGKMSPLEEVSNSIFKGKTFPRETVVSVGTSRVIVLANNPNRLSWQIINESAIDVRVSNDATLTSASGWLVASNGGVVSMVYYDDGEAVGYQLFGIAVAAGASLRIRELLRL